MVETAKKIKEANAEVKVIFIGPCIAKKYEALTEKVSEYIDHVLSFEELADIFVAFGIDSMSIEGKQTINDARTLGLGFANAGGVGTAIIETAENKFGISNIQYEKADTLADCLEMLGKIKRAKPVPISLWALHAPAAVWAAPEPWHPCVLHHLYHLLNT